MIIDGKNARLGRLASYSAKKALGGEEIIIINCDKVIITGNKKDIKEDFEQRRRRGGSAQKGPYTDRTSEKIVKRSIGGMLPDYRDGRGRAAWKRIKCYNGEPKELKSGKIINLENPKQNKFIQITELLK